VPVDSVRSGDISDDVSASPPLVTVRVPAYNHEAFIDRCLDSVLEQDYPNIELIIIDDGSTDGTADRIRGWLARHEGEIPATFRSRQNRGLTATLNELLKLARGRYLVSLASDDYLLPAGVSTRVEYLETHPGKLAVMGDCIVVDAHGGVMHSSALSGLRHVDKRNYLTDAGIKKEVVARWSVPGPVLMVDRRLYSRVGQYDESLIVEDWDLYLRMVSQDLLGFVDSPVAAYRLHGANVSRDPGQATTITRQLLRTAVKNFRRFDTISRLRLSMRIIRLSIGFVLLKCGISPRLRR